MLIQQGRTLAPDINTAIEQIRAKHGEGRLSLRACPIQPVKGMTWFDFCIEKEEIMDSCMTCQKDCKQGITGCPERVPVESLTMEKTESQYTPIDNDEDGEDE